MNSLVRRIMCKKFVNISTSSGPTCYSYIQGSSYHSSPSLCKYSNTRNNIRKLEKMLIQKKKKFYYDPMNVSQLGKLATGVSGGKTKVQREDSIRLRTYNKILFDNLRDMMTTNLVSDELEELQVSIIRVQVSGDMSACRVFWMATGSVEEDDRIEEILNRYRGPLRRALISHRVLGKIPPIFFMKDKVSANISQVERLLSIADFGPKEELPEEKHLEEEAEEILKPVGKMEFIKKFERTSKDDDGGIAQPSLFGIDHAALNQMIRTQNKKIECEDAPLTGLEDAVNIDKKFAQFRAFMKKRKLSKAERKQAAFYMGELDSYKSNRLRNLRDDVQDEETSEVNIKDLDSDDYEEYKDK
ncbi:putative ribosome-binding factor A, mitochondrial [Asterias rubens]|uniref:putative ribosome-binding factor A, mitochondrial n=1 Tax=Asterias rubens TaxID=7604 RepID=UPI0014551E29|nr:putative ribosome-binding factor A, mitochondrial [Asterias rubens]